MLAREWSVAHIYVPHGGVNGGDLMVHNSRCFSGLVTLVAAGTLTDGGRVATVAAGMVMVGEEKNLGYDYICEMEKDDDVAVSN